MNIYLTFDYELFFGSQTGSVMKCIIEPTNRLLEIAQKHQVKLTFFVDTAYLIALKKNASTNDQLHEEYQLIEEQLKRISQLGHTCQLHIHPHWEDSYYDGGWQLTVKRYKLSDFSKDEISALFKKNKALLESITGIPVSVYRAGGWSLQPFSIIKEAFLHTGIKIDSTVFKGGYLNDDTHFFDFRKTPLSENWRFSDDLCEEDTNGMFLEVPISTYTYSPLFFWQLYGLGRIFTKRHKSIGDGRAISSNGTRWKYLTATQNLPVSSDGFFASKLPVALNNLKSQGMKNMVVIGHPKACTVFSFEKLEQFIAMEKGKHRFLPMSTIV